MERKTIVVSAFPACGKSYFSSKNSSLKVSDSDSSNFHRNGRLDVDWYVNGHIKSMIGKCDYIFVSSHLDVRHKMEKEGIKFVTVYPSLDSKDAFLKRMRERGNDEKFLKLLNTNWENWVGSIENEPHGEKIVYLNKNECLSDVLEKL